MRFNGNLQNCSDNCISEGLPIWIKRGRHCSELTGPCGPVVFYWQEVGWESSPSTNTGYLLWKRKGRSEGRSNSHGKTIPDPNRGTLCFTLTDFRISLTNDYYVPSIFPFLNGSFYYDFPVPGWELYVGDVGERKSLSFAHRSSYQVEPCLVTLICTWI